MTPERPPIHDAMESVRDGRPVKLVFGFLDDQAVPPRLYPTTHLDHYVEVPEVIAVEHDAASGASLVWLAADQRLELLPVDPAEAEGRFLDITDLDQYLSPPGGLPDVPGFPIQQATTTITVASVLRCPPGGDITYGYPCAFTLRCSPGCCICKRTTSHTIGLCARPLRG